MKKDQIPQEVKVENDPSKCVCCEKRSVASFKVHLVEKKGQTTVVCYVARCAYCGKVKYYGLTPGIFKMPLRKPDTNISRWPEILRNDIDPVKFVDAILNFQNKPVWLSAKDLQYDVQEKPAFYEPGYFGRAE